MSTFVFARQIPYIMFGLSRPCGMLKPTREQTRLKNHATAKAHFFLKETQQSFRKSLPFAAVLGLILAFSEHNLIFIG